MIDRIIVYEDRFEEKLKANEKYCVTEKGKRGENAQFLSEKLGE